MNNEKQKMNQNNETDSLMNAVKENQTPGTITNSYTFPSSCIEVSLWWRVEEGKKLDLDNSCMAVNSNGDVLMDESVYFGHLMNSNGSINHSGEEINGGKETIYCNLDFVPLCVHELFFILTVATKEKTLKDANNALVKVIDTTSGKPLCQYSPKSGRDSPSALLMRITRASENWKVSLVEPHMRKTAKKIGNLIPEALEHDLESGKNSNYDNNIEKMRLQIEAQGSLIASMEEKLDEMSSLVNISNGLTNDTMKQEESYYILENDVYNLIMLSEPNSITWFYSLLVIFFQMIIVILILIKQLEDTIAIPFTVNTSVTIAQFFALLISTVTQIDMFESIKTIVVICHEEETDWRRTFKVPEHIALRNRRKYLRVIIPNFFKFCCGALVLTSSFIIIINSDDVIGLFTNFAALQIISQIDNVFFSLGEHGFFGRTIQMKTKQAKDVPVPDRLPSCCRKSLPLQLVATVLFFAGMIVGWSYFVIEQENGTIFSTKYPNCDITTSELVKIGDGTCDGGVFNTIQCDFDGGDCILFNLAFPECGAVNPSLIGDGTCQEENNNENCGFDGSDCCPFDKSDPLLGDGECHGLWYNTKQCGFDGGDCEEFNNSYQECFVDLKRISIDSMPVILGDGICDGNIYNTEACGYEHGDCIYMQNNPSIIPTTQPTKIPSLMTTKILSTNPSYISTTQPTKSPSLMPTKTLSTNPSYIPTAQPTESPSLLSTKTPTSTPTSAPTSAPTTAPTLVPSSVPSISPRWVQLGSNIDGENTNDRSGISISLSDDGQVVAIGTGSLYGGGDFGYYSVRAFTYNSEESKWDELGSDIGKNSYYDDYDVVVSLSDDGQTMAIGAYRNEREFTISGYTRVYRYNNTDWYQVGSDIDGENTEDYSGRSVSLSGDGQTVALGTVDLGFRADENDGNGIDSGGHVRVYRYNDKDWNQLGSDIDGENYDESSVSLSDDGQIVAILGTGHEFGHVRTYRYNSEDSNWVQQEPNFDGGETSCDGSVSLSGDGQIMAIIGYDNYSIDWHVRIYKYNDEEPKWSQLGSYIDGDNANDYSGWSVSLSDDGQTVAIGSNENNDNGINSAHVRVYKYKNTDWYQVGSDIDGENTEDYSSRSISLSDDGQTVAIGVSSGHVRVYKYTSS